MTVRDLFYGTVLPSGGDAALGLAIYTAGSQEAFVEMMNAKLEEAGIAKIEEELFRQYTEWAATR